MEILGKPRFLRIVFVVVAIVACCPVPAVRVAAQTTWLTKLDPLLQPRTSITGRSRVVMQAVSKDAVSSVLALLPLLGGRVVRSLPIVNGAAIDLPNTSLALLAGNALVGHLSMDRVVAGAMERTGATVGATAVRQQLGYDGSGIGVAVIDSGVTAWHDDLSQAAGGQRVDRFVDFVNGRTAAYDDYGHGTHVAGIVAGNGSDSGGARAGIAPGSRLIVLKVLDGAGAGRISDVIAALDYVVTNREALNIRVANLSVATGVYESYNVDPLTIAARKAVEAGIVVVAAAGNYGRAADGTPRYGGITAPGNAPWVLTAGASSHMGTIDRADDTIAAFSSRGPGAIDLAAKPDLVAPGVGIESLSDPGSSLYVTASAYLLNGTGTTAYPPYMSLSGTSMSTPVVAGTVALMLQANPSLSPDSVKAILQYTAQPYPGYDTLTQGAGFLNAKGAVELAAYLQSPAGATLPDATGWSGHVIWGGQAVAVSVFDLQSIGTVWSLTCSVNCGVMWGPPTVVSSTSTAEGDTVVWGTSTGEADTVVWGTSTGEGDTVVWGTSAGEGDTVVWGTSCSDPSCEPVVWSGR
jgi:serine protease AprX